MRRILIATLVLLSVSAVLGATVFQEQVALAAEKILPVRVVNTADAPVPVAEVAGASDREPYEHSTFFNQTPTTCTQFVCHVSFPAVPAGKRLVVTYASARYRLTAGGTSQSVEVGVNGNGINDPQILLPAPQHIGFDQYIASGPVTFYAEAGDVPTISLGGQHVQPVSNTANVSIVGYLIPAS